MKVIFIIDKLSFGGAQRVALSLTKRLCEHDVECKVIALNKHMHASYTVGDIPFSYLNGHGKILELRRRMKYENPHIVVTLGTPICIYTVPALWGLDVKHIVSERNSPANFAGKWITKVLSRMLMKAADGFVFQTKQAQDYYAGSIAKRSVVIPNPIIDLSDFVPVPSEEREKKIVSVGRLAKQKNFKLLIDAFSALPDRYSEYKLVIYGDGPERGELSRRVEEKGLSGRVSMPGTSEHVHQDIANATLFVMSSDFEGMPNALMEAMALGLPCISTDCPCGGPTELIKDGKNGLLVPVGNKDAMVTAMVRVLDDNVFSETLSKMAINIRDTHNLDIICKMWLRYFDSFLNENNSSS